MRNQLLAVLWILATMCIAGPIAAQPPNLAGNVRQTYRGAETPDSLAFRSLLDTVRMTADERVETFEDPLAVYYIQQHMRYDREDAAIFVQVLSAMYHTMDIEAEATVVESVCVPEATEWWPDTTALEALDNIGVIRETVYQNHYQALLDTLSESDRTRFMKWLEDSKQGLVFSREKYVEGYADRPEVAQAILVQFCASRIES